MAVIRIDRFVANNMNVSRKEAAFFIRKGLVCISGQVVKSTSFSLNTDTDTVTVNGQNVEYKKYVYFILNKPQGILSASTDKSRETVIDLIPKEKRRQGLFPVGRLDKDTTGLLIITDDGTFAHNCISPKKEIPKSYIVTLDGNIKEEAIKKFSDGIILADGTKCRPAKLQILENNVARVIITEGKYHQIKRMFGALSLGVTKLHRESIGSLKLPNNLNMGQCIEVSLDDLTKCIINNKQNTY